MIIDGEPIGNPSDSGQLAPTARRPAPILGVRPPAAELAAQTAATEPTHDEAATVPTAAEAPAATPTVTPTITIVADAGYSSADDAITREKLGVIRGSEAAYGLGVGFPSSRCYARSTRTANSATGRTSPTTPDAIS